MRRALRIGTVLLVIVAALVLASTLGVHHHPNADPGGRLLASLKTTREVAPVGADVTLVQAYEPKWDSCDGMAGTFGYGAAYFDMTFRSQEMPTAVIHAAVATMRSHGWILSSSSVDDPHGAHAHWRMRLYTGNFASAELVLQKQGSPPYWEVAAEAPPAVGAATSGC